ncbi:MAG TPA: hypothetical protein VN784_04565 [Candidatus Limnocylindrales bacterium]|nr:hypothetical protein [Candidatus Limnocylindrales bacterium]
MKRINWLVLAATGVFVAVYFYSGQVPAPLAFKPITVSAFTGLFAWLFAVALFVERAVEVVTLIFRDQQADILVEARKNVEKTADTQAIVNARKAIINYRAETKQIAQLISFTSAILISLAGVRALAALLSDAAAPTGLFVFVDILTTGLVIAGGSEGIHQMANVFSSFMESLTAQAQKKAQNP